MIAYEREVVRRVWKKSGNKRLVVIREKRDVDKMIAYKEKGRKIKEKL